MARAKSERARSKSLAIDDLTQSIEQLQAFIPKLEDLGRDGFPYLEGALTRTELQLRECIKRAFGDKSPEFQTHRHLKLALSSATEKKQTLTLLRSLIASLEDKKLELQGLKPAVAQAAPLSTPPQIGLVPPSGSTAQVSVTTVTTTSRPTGTTLHLVPGVDNGAVTAPPVAAAAPVTSTPAPPVVESAPTPVVSPVQSIPPRTPIEPISSLFRTQETKPVPPAPEQTVPAPTPPPAVAAPARAAVPSPPPSPAAVTPPSPTPVASPSEVLTAPSTTTPQSQSASGAFMSTQEVPLQPSYVSETISPTAPQATATSSAVTEVDHLSITKKVCQRFHVVARQLRLRGEYRSTINVEDECDVQDLMHALLRQHFDDIGTDEWTPSYNTGAPRTTYLLDHDRLAIVVKKTRTGLSRKDLVDQVRADVERYRNRGRCAHLLCFVYDPEGRIGNPRGLESELCTTSEHFAVDVVVAPK
jgi:hypothetical protein